MVHIGHVISAFKTFERAVANACRPQSVRSLEDHDAAVKPAYATLQAFCMFHHLPIDFTQPHAPRTSTNEAAGPADDSNSLRHQRDLLAEALGKLLVAHGVIRGDVALTGPELLLAAEDALLVRPDAVGG